MCIEWSIDWLISKVVLSTFKLTIQKCVYRWYNIMYDCNLFVLYFKEVSKMGTVTISTSDLSSSVSKVCSFCGIGDSANQLAMCLFCSKPHHESCKRNPDLYFTKFIRQICSLVWHIGSIRILIMLPRKTKTKHGGQSGIKRKQFFTGHCLENWNTLQILEYSFCRIFICVYSLN
jgi:hypothetical protein